MANVTMGTLVHGTARPEHLIPAFIDELCRHDRDAAYLYARHGLDALNDPEEQTELVGLLLDALSYYAPPGHYFGALVGDSSDFGYWPEEREDYE